MFFQQSSPIARGSKNRRKDTAAYASLSLFTCQRTHASHDRDVKNFRAKNHPTGCPVRRKAPEACRLGHRGGPPSMNLFYSIVPIASTRKWKNFSSLLRRGLGSPSIQPKLHRSQKLSVSAFTLHQATRVARYLSVCRQRSRGGRPVTGNRGSCR